jgi:hypothetical protein
MTKVNILFCLSDNFMHYVSSVLIKVMYFKDLKEEDSLCLNGGTPDQKNPTVCSCPPGFGGAFCEIGEE